jgi:hypothetical protein
MNDKERPVIAIYHLNDEWRVECPAMPDLEVSAGTLWSLLHMILHRVSGLVEAAIKTAAQLATVCERCGEPITDEKDHIAGYGEPPGYDVHRHCIPG